MIDKITSEPAKKVMTKDQDGANNGFLIECFKEGDKTIVYLSAANPGAFKGYHLHRVRAARYLALKGKMKIHLYTFKEGQWEYTEKILDASNPQPERLFIPKNVATGLENIGVEEGWLINYPDPPYDPNLKDEQVEYTLEELHQGVVK